LPPAPAKCQWQDLALFGGPPAFKQPLPVGRPYTGNREALFARWHQMLDRQWLTNHGPFAQELERRVAAYTGAAHCILTSSGTAALELAIAGAELRGEVLVPAYTFIATVHALRWLGLTPVFCDVDPRTHNLDPRDALQRITSRTTGILGVHLWGRPCDIDALTALARQHGLRLLFDAAHAFGCTYRGRRIGTFGNAEVFSFHATKFFHTLEGGAVVTNDAALAERVRRLRNFGLAAPDQIAGLGINAKMSEASAAFGLTLFDELDALLAGNQRNHLRYREHLRAVSGLQVIEPATGEQSNCQYLVVEVGNGKATALLAALRAENIHARRYFHPGCHRVPPYANGLKLPVTEQLTESVISLPAGPAISVPEIDLVCDVIRLAMPRI